MAGGEVGIVFYTRKPLFLSGGHYFTVDDKRGSTIMVVGRDS